MALSRDQASRVLNVAENCSEGELRQAYRDLIRVWHPDRFPDPHLKEKTQEQMKLIVEAYSVLASQSAPAELAVRYPKMTREQNQPPPVAPPSSRTQLWPFVVAGMAALLPVLGWYLVESTRTVEHAIGMPARQSKLFHPSGAVNPTADLADGIDNLQTWAQMQIPELRRAGLIVVTGKAMPAASPRREPPIRPATGELTQPVRPYGTGQLDLANGTGVDAAIRVLAGSPSGSAFRSVYIRAAENFVIRDLPPGNYFVTVELGNEWTASSGFSIDRERGEPIGPLSYVRIQSAKWTWSDEYRVEIRR